jgi:alpha-ribazole phosphatase
MKLWLVRHARPLIESGVCYGATDMPADAQATEACAQALAQVLPEAVRVMTSPLQRCAQLAKALQTLRPDLHATPDARLAEMNFGCWEGVLWDDIPKDAYAHWMAAFNTCRFGGRESMGEFMQRVARVRADTVAQARPSVWITHAGVARAMTLLAQGLALVERADQWPKNAPEWGQWWEREV